MTTLTKAAWAALVFSLSLWPEEPMMSPARLPGCSNFYVADDLSQQPDRAAVELWASRCGNSSAQKLSNTPTLLKRALNGHAAVHFDSTPLLTNYTGTPRTFYVVARVQNPYKSHAVIGGKNDQGEGSYYFEIQGAFLNYKQGEGHVGASDPNGPTVNSWFVMSASAALSKEKVHLTLSKNFDDAGAIHATAPFHSFVRSGPALLGGAYYNGNPADFCQCDIAALITYDRVLAPAEALLVERWIESTFFGQSFSKKFYLLAFSNANPNQSILEVSDDGINFTSVDIVGVAGGRDPSPVHHNGQYYAVTTFAGDQIQLMTSRLGGIWHPVMRMKPCHSANQKSACYAPEFFRDSDGSLHVLVFDSPDGIAGMVNEIHPLAPNLTAWSEPQNINVPLKGTQGCDPFLLKTANSVYHLFVGGCGAGISHWTASNVFGPWQSQISPEFGNVEGVSIVRMGNRYRAYLDGSVLQRTGTFTYSESEDLIHWGPIRKVNSEFVFGGFMQHGTVKYSADPNEL